MDSSAALASKVQTILRDLSKKFGVSYGETDDGVFVIDPKCKDKLEIQKELTSRLRNIHHAICSGNVLEFICAVSKDELVAQANLTFEGHTVTFYDPDENLSKTVRIQIRGWVAIESANGMYDCYGPICAAKDEIAILKYISEMYVFSDDVSEEEEPEVDIQRKDAIESLKENRYLSYRGRGCDFTITIRECPVL